MVRGLDVPDDLAWADVRGATLAYRVVGTGDRVVFVHGSISDLTTWDRQLPVVGMRFRAIAYSRRYAWPNDDLVRGERDMMASHIDDLLAFLRVVNAYPAHLVGNSYGAFICLRAALREPPAARSLVLDEPPLVPLVAGNPPSVVRALRALVRHPALTLAMLRFVAETLGPVQQMVARGDIEDSIERFARGVLGPSCDRLPADARAHMQANASTHVGQVLADGGLDSITEADIRGVRTRTLVVTGAESPPMFRHLAALLSSLLPNAQRLTVPAACHAMHLQNAEDLNAGLLAFFDRESAVS
jgi:pimeloyl-ACP methyl ester carboxylesterase